MSKKDKSYDYGEEKPEISTRVAEIEVPDGMDDAIYRQGYAAAVEDAKAVAAVRECAFAAGTPQAASWLAGYDAGSGWLPAAV